MFVNTSTLILIVYNRLGFFYINVVEVNRRSFVLVLELSRMPLFLLVLTSTEQHGQVFFIFLDWRGYLSLLLVISIYVNTFKGRINTIALVTFASSHALFPKHPRHGSLTNHLVIVKNLLLHNCLLRMPIPLVLSE